MQLKFNIDWKPFGSVKPTENGNHWLSEAYCIQEAEEEHLLVFSICKAILFCVLYIIVAFNANGNYS